MTGPSPEVRNTCPSADELAGFNIGILPAADAERLADHLASCSACVSLLQTLPDTDDSLIAGLRQPPPGDGIEEEPACERARATARAIAHTTSQSLVPPALPERQQIREYQLVAPLQAGGMGMVYKAVHTRLKKPVAIKLLTLGRRLDAEAVARFQREMEAIGRLDHPHIVRATDAGEEEGLHFLVMELVDGISLSELVDKCGPLPAAEACELIRQAALGLEHALEHGLVHRDIKPSNLMLARDGRVKVLDLGLALLRGTQPLGKELTATGQIMGTLEYMAPEQARDTRAVDIRADLYSLGCTLYKLLTGRPPFDRFETTLELLLAHALEPPPALRERRPDLPDGLAKVLERLLAKDPAERFNRPLELAHALEPFTVGCNLKRLLSRAGIAATVAAEPSVTRKEPSPAVAPVPPRSRRRFQVAMMTAVGAAVLGGALTWYLRGNREGVSPDPETGWVNLLPRIDRQRDAVAGTWSMSDGALVSDATQFACLELPYTPPASYDFRIEFSSAPGQGERGRGEVCQVFVASGLQARWAMWCLDYEHFGFIWDESAFNRNNPTMSRLGQPLEPGRRYVSLVEVRPTEVRAFLDGQLRGQWRPEQGLPNNLPHVRLSSRQRLGVGSFESIIRFHRIEVRERATQAAGPEAREERGLQWEPGPLRSKLPRLARIS